MSAPAISPSNGPIDVQGMVTQLMTVANQPLDRMHKQISSYNSQISDYGAINSDLTSMQGTLTNLSSGQFINTFSATSSDAAVLSATASSAETAGLYNVSVNNLATSQNLAFDGQGSEQDSLGNYADTMSFNFADGTSAAVKIAANSSLDQISNAINSAGVGVSSSVVKADNSATPYRLVLTGTTVGSDKAFSTSVSPTEAPQPGTVLGPDQLSFLNFDAGAAVDATGKVTDGRLTAQANDANLTVNGLNMTSRNNTVSTAINGVTMNLTQTGSTTLTIAADTSAIEGQVKSFVTAFNKVQADASALYSGDLHGDYTLVSLQNQFAQILNTPISGADGGNTVAYLAQVGVSLQKDGTLSLDTNALTHAISNNGAAVANVFGNSNNDGFAQRFNAQINNFLGPTGMVSVRSSTLNKQVKNLQDDAAQEQTRLNTLQAGYMSQYSSLNSSLTKMQQTSSSLSKILAQ